MSDPWINPPVMARPPATIYPTPALQALPAPPAAVTDAIASLRQACAAWAPHQGTSDHHAELQACDVVLNRDGDFPVGVSLGVCSTLAFVGFIGVSRSLIQARACSRGDSAAFFGALAFVGLLAGYVLSWPITWARGDVWTDAQDHLAVAGCIGGTVGLLFVLRWAFHRPVAA